MILKVHVLTNFYYHLLLLLFYYYFLNIFILLVNGLRADEPCIKRICMYVCMTHFYQFSLEPNL